MQGAHHGKNAAFAGWQSRYFCTHTHMHARARAHTHTHACMHAYVHARTHAHIHGLQPEANGEGIPRLPVVYLLQRGVRGAALCGAQELEHDGVAGLALQQLPHPRQVAVHDAHAHCAASLRRFRRRRVAAAVLLWHVAISGGPEDGNELVAAADPPLGSRGPRDGRDRCHDARRARVHEPLPRRLPHDARRARRAPVVGHGAGTSAPSASRRRAGGGAAPAGPHPRGGVVVHELRRVRPSRGQ